MEKNFASAPTVSIGRSKYNRVSSHKTSFNLGDIVPLYVDEVLPGSTHKIDVASLIRMSTPIAPIMDDIVMELFAFFVPHRLVWDNWKQFMGESPNAGISTAAEKYIPQTTLVNTNESSLGSYMGLPLYNGQPYEYVSMLPLRAYCLIYNRWFRNQNVETPIIVPTNDVTLPSIVPISGGQAVTYDYGLAPLTAYKKADYFTSALPYAQKGSAVRIPLEGLLPVVTGAEHSITSHEMIYRDQSTTPVKVTGILQTNASGEAFVSGSPDYTGATYAIPSNLWADVASATTSTVNDIRMAFAVQRLLEKDALYGSRYWEILYGHFGVKSPDASLQDPEYLGGMKFYINIDQVLQTTGFDTTAANNTLGTPGANSVTGNNGSIFSKSFTEHGTLMILGVARQKQHSYCQGINRMWKRSRRYDFYDPVFANLGAQEIRNSELYIDPVNGVTGNFGFQEAWAEYRYKPSITSGVLNVAASSSLDYWTLTDEFNAQPTLGQIFLKEDRGNLARCLVTGVSGPDFIGDFLFNDVTVNPMPLYSVPGLIDHH